MAANAINNFFGANSQGLGLGAFGGLGMAASTKPPLMERYHDEHSHGWQKSSKGGNKKGNVALSALTLLAFLFFLHILQNCIQDHMHEMKGHHYKGQKFVQNFSNILVFDTGNLGNIPGNIVLGRDNLKGDDGLLPESGEDLELDQWPLKSQKEQKDAQRRVLKPQHKKNQKQKQNKPKHRNGQPTPVGMKNSIPGLAYPVESHEVDIPMHRIDNIP